MKKRLIEYNLPLADISEASTCEMSVRYIEVKDRARSGAIRLSANEWKKARHFGGKFWLYVVTLVPMIRSYTAFIILQRISAWGGHRRHRLHHQRGDMAE
ncbi:MAG: DUF3883 domain-containing protein [Chloroflexota bacterium]|nr:DUF3883 domain-containing protein [Chloroflexota bacterium]